jgi:hypothetical protein
MRSSSPDLLVGAILIVSDTMVLMMPHTPSRFSKSGSCAPSSHERDGYELIFICFAVTTWLVGVRLARLVIATFYCVLLTPRLPHIPLLAPILRQNIAIRSFRL